MQLEEGNSQTAECGNEQNQLLKTKKEQIKPYSDDQRLHHAQLGTLPPQCDYE